MCEPATLAMIALGTMAAGTVVTAVGAIQQGNAARKQADFNSQVSRNNAVLATRQADDSLKRGRLRERQLRLKQSKQEGATRAAFSANNVALDEGSPLDVLVFGAEQNELEALTIRNAAEREATGFEARAAGLSAEASLFTAAGKQAQTAGRFNAFSSVLAGASQATGQAAKFRTSGTI